MRLELFFKRKHAGRQLFNSNLMIEFTSSAGGCERAAFRLYPQPAASKAFAVGHHFWRPASCLLKMVRFSRCMNSSTASSCGQAWIYLIWGLGRQIAILHFMRLRHLDGIDAIAPYATEPRDGSYGRPFVNIAASSRWDSSAGLKSIAASHTCIRVGDRWPDTLATHPPPL